MSEGLRELAVSHFNEAIDLMKKEQIKEALNKLELAEEAAQKGEADDTFLHIMNLKGHLLLKLGAFEEAIRVCGYVSSVFSDLVAKYPEEKFFHSSLQFNLNNVGNLGNLLRNMGRFLQAKHCYELHLSISQKLLLTDPENVAYQSSVAMTLNNLGALLSDMGRIEDAKNRYENALDIYEKLLLTYPENVAYQSDVAMTLNNLGALLKNMGRIEDAKNKYENSLKIYIEPMQYLTISKRSHAIIKLIGLNSEQAENESNFLNKAKYLEETVKLCKEHRSFFITYGLDHERKLVTEAGLSSYIDNSMINVRFETDSCKRAKQYEKAFQAIEKLSEIENDETVSKLFSSAACYLWGRKLVNEALTPKKPDLNLLKQAVEQFKIARETYDTADVCFYKKADMCFCIYTGLLKILEKIENLEKVDIPKLKELILEVVNNLPENVDPGIRASFENIPQIFEEKDTVMRKELLRKLDQEIDNIEYKALEKLFGHVNDKIKDYFEEPFSPNLFYNNWKLRITLDAEKIKGKLTVKTGNTILFDQILNREEIKDNAIEIDYLERKYIPERKDTIIFETPNQKPVVRDIDYSETISVNKKACIFLHNFGNGCARGALKIASIQLKYDVYIEDSAVKIVDNEAYKQKVMATLGAVKEEADVVVFPEFSIPFDYLREIQDYANENEIIVFAGTHYITEENLEKYEGLFTSNFVEEDFRKNICPVVIPNSGIIHSEKMFGAKEERALFSNNGMKQGKLNRIFKLWDILNIGVLICFEYLNDELRHRLISACDVILVPQTNPNPRRFYEAAKNDLNNPLCAGNKACIMANGLFRIGKTKDNQFEPENEEIYGGSSGVILTLDKDSTRMLEKGIFSQKEQFVLLATINLQYSPARDIQIAPEPIKTSVIHIFEKDEILLIQEENKEKFLTFLDNINACTDRKELKKLIEENRALIGEFSPLMSERTSNLNNLDFDEIKEKCRSILIQAS